VALFILFTWTASLQDEELNASSYGSVGLQAPEEDIIPFEDLTEEMVLGWIQSVVIGSYEEHVNEKIAEEISSKVNPIVSVTGGFPWESEDEVTEGSSGSVSEVAPVEIAST